MIIVIGTLQADPEHVDELVVLCIEHSQRSRREPGCVSHTIHRDAEDPHRLFFFERWEGADALRTHFRVPASGEFVAALTSMCRQRPVMEILAAEPAAV